MSVRAMWKGAIHLGDAVVPVKLYAALQSRGVSFRLLDDEEHQPVTQELVQAETGQPVAREDLRRGVEVAPGTFAILTDEELATLEPSTDSRAIVPTRFVRPGSIDERLYDRAYWLGPDGDAEAYFALVRALRDSGREGIVHWVMRKRHHAGALRVSGDHLALLRLRHADEVVGLGAIPVPKGREPDDRELALARQLVAAFEGDFDPGEFPETYAERVQQLVRAKAEGEATSLPEPRTDRGRTDELHDALEQSLAAVSDG